jgi:hypothetical protein
MCGRSVTRSRIELPRPWYSATGQSPQGCSSTPTQSDFCSPASEVMRLSSPHKQPHRTAQEKTVIAHVSIGVCDIDRNKPFYDAALEPLGYKCLRQVRTLAGWRVRARALRSGSSPLSARFRPTKSRVCTSRFVAPSRAAADAFHAAAFAGRNCIEFLNWSGRGDSNPRPQPWQGPASKMNRNCGMSSTPGVALVMPRRRRRADVVSLVMMGPCRRSQPLRARRRGH